MTKPPTRCIARETCHNKARFYVTNDGTLRMRCCGKHLVQLVIKMRKPIGRGITSIYIQKYNPDKEV